MTNMGTHHLEMLLYKVIILHAKEFISVLRQLVADT